MVRYLIKSQKKTGENTGLLLNGSWDLITDDMEKMDVPSASSPQYVLHNVFQQCVQCF